VLGPVIAGTIISVIAVPYLMVIDATSHFSLRQAIVPNHMLGRVLSVAGVLAVSAMPLGSLAGGFLIEQTHQVGLIFGAIGILLFLMPLAFTQTALGHADRYLPPEARLAPREGH
jgi:uncharacterized BrkB/YihY/UPF0761 family membrane protein